MLIPLTDANWKILTKINRDINKLPYKTDMALYHRPDFWTFMQEKGGDCEDYVLTKRQKLIEAGFDYRCLLPAIGWDVNGQGHCVLLINTDKGAYVMDNNVDSVIPWTSQQNSIKKWHSHLNENGKWISFG